MKEDRREPVPDLVVAQSGGRFNSRLLSEKMNQLQKQQLAVPVQYRGRLWIYFSTQRDTHKVGYFLFKKKKKPSLSLKQSIKIK